MKIHSRRRRRREAAGKATSNHLNPQDEEETKTFLQSKYLLHLNVAACYQKLGDHVKAIESCNKVLEECPQHVKALYRRGMSHMATADFDEAKSDFNAMMAVDKNSGIGCKSCPSKIEEEATDWFLVATKEDEANAWKQFKGLFDRKPGELSAVEPAEVKKKERAMEDLKDNVDVNNDAASSGHFSSSNATVEQTSRSWLNWRSWFRGFPSTKCTIL